MTNPGPFRRATFQFCRKVVVIGEKCPISLDFDRISYPIKVLWPQVLQVIKVLWPQVTKSPALRMYSIQSEFVSRLATLIHDNPYRPPRTRSSHITVCVARIGISMSLMSSIGLVLVGNSLTWTSQLGTGLVLLAVPAFLVCSAALLTGRKKKLSLCGIAIAFIVVCYYPTIFAFAR